MKVWDGIGQSLFGTCRRTIDAGHVLLLLPIPLFEMWGYLSLNNPLKKSLTINLDSVSFSMGGERPSVWFLAIQVNDIFQHDACLAVLLLDPRQDLTHGPPPCKSCKMIKMLFPMGPKLFWELFFPLLFFYVLSCQFPLLFAAFWSWKLPFNCMLQHFGVRTSHFP